MKKSTRLDKLRDDIKRKRRENARKPTFRRPESWRYKRLDTGWRRPKGIDSAIRKREAGQSKMPNIGYRSPKRLRHLHPSGLKEVLVHNLDELDGLHPKEHAVRIAQQVGDRKRLAILERADDLGLHILNPQLKSPLPEIVDSTLEEPR